MANSSFYPELRVGDKIEVAIEPKAPETRWRLGEVTALKTDSCDAHVHNTEGGEERHDLIHIADPRCHTTRDWAGSGRGVFRLATVEIERRRDAKERVQLFARMDAIERSVEELNRQLENRTVDISAQVPHRGPGRPRLTPV